MPRRTRRARTAGLAVLAIACLAPTALPQPGSETWTPLTFRSVTRHTAYAQVPGGEGVRADADCSASGLVLPLQRVDLRATPTLRWRWWVERPLRIEDEQSRAGDDFAARVYVMFRFQPEKASFFQRARQRISSRLLGSEVPGSVLNFVWSSRAEPGSRWTSPYSGESKLLALAQGPAADGGSVRGWREEAVDVAAEYRRSFAQEPPELLALGIMTDADDACQRASARYADFRFTEAPL